MSRRIALTALAVAVAFAFVGARRRAGVPVAPPAGPTFSKEIARIFQANCQSCHHEGDIAPFALMSYDDAKSHAALIKMMTQSRQMPPWKPTADSPHFVGARVLSQSDIDTIAKWVDSGAPEGNRADLPAPLHFDSNWTLGAPDLTLASAQAYTPAVGTDTYRCFTIPANVSADKYVSAIDVHPGDRETVHHVIAYIDTTGASAKLDADEPGPGYTCFGGPGFDIVDIDAATLGGWAPGARPVTLPDGVALKLPANSRVVLQVHYHPHHGTPSPDQTEIGIYYAKQKPRQLLRIIPLINQSFTIPPGQPAYHVNAGFTVPLFLSAHVHVIAPHMHLLGRSMKVQANYADGTKQTLINIDDWDFNWQGLYRYQEPIAIPTGTFVSVDAVYDNSVDNWRNPNNPPKPVSWGEQTTDEMCIAFLGVTIDAENLTQGKKADTSTLPHF